MLRIIAASSLYNSIEELQIKLREQLRELVHAGPGFSLNPESVNKSKDVYTYLKSEELRNTRIILWHDLINTITPHKVPTTGQGRFVTSPLGDKNFSPFR